MKKLFEIRDRHPIIARAVSDVLYFAALLLSDLALRYIHVECKTSPFGRDVPLLYTLCWCAVFTALAMLLPKIVRRIYVIFTESVFALIALIHAFFYSFFGSYMSFSSVTFAETGADFFDWSYFSIPKKLLLALAAAVLLSVAAALLTPKKVNLKILPIILSVVLIAAGVVGINCLSEKNFSDAGGITWNSTQTPAEVYETFTDQFTCMHMVGLYQYSFRDFMVSTGLDDVWLKFNNSSAVKELDAYYASKETDPDNEMTGIFKGKNLILIQLEAIDTWMLNGDVMPNLNRLRSEGINFSNYYAPKYLWGATFNSENVANTGLISPTNSSKVSYFNKTAYPYSMANVFKAAGYDTNSFHRSNGNVYNRGTIHINWGYNTYNSAPSLGISEIDLDSKFIEAYDKMVSEDKFMSFYITYSGHGPYNSETKEAQLYYDEIKALVPEDAEEEYICALCHARETDNFIGELIDRLTEDGHIDDTVLVFYTDHYDHYISDSEILTKYKGTSDANLLCNVPFFIYSADCAPMTVEKYVATYDILPTVVNLFGFDVDGRYYLGNDAFAENGGYVIFSDRSWIDSEEYYNVYSSTPTEKSKARSEEIAARLNACWNSIKIDYFKDK